MDTLKSRPTRGKVRDLDRSANLVCYSENLSVRLSCANRTSSSLSNPLLVMRPSRALPRVPVSPSSSSSPSSAGPQFHFLCHSRLPDYSPSIPLRCMRLLFTRRTDAPSVRFLLGQEYLPSRARTFSVAKISSLSPIHLTVKTHDHRNLVSFNAKLNPTSRGSASGIYNSTRL